MNPRTFQAGLDEWMKGEPSARKKEAADKILRAFTENQTTLNLEGYGLSSLPLVIGELTNLEDCNLRGNALWRFPKTFENLQELKKLRIDSNKFSNIPEVLFSLEGLQYLDISWNKIKNISGKIQNLKNLEYLSAEHNDIGFLPREVGYLSFLGEINASWNSLQDVPDEIGNLPRLHTLILRGNTTLKDIPSAFKRRSNVQLIVDPHIHLNAPAMLPSRETPTQYSFAASSSKRKLLLYTLNSCFYSNMEIFKYADNRKSTE